MKFIIRNGKLRFTVWGWTAGGGGVEYRSKTTTFMVMLLEEDERE
jgi:hypothetical protein